MPIKFYTQFEYVTYWLLTATSLYIGLMLKEYLSVVVFVLPGLLILCLIAFHCLRRKKEPGVLSQIEKIAEEFKKNEKMTKTQIQYMFEIMGTERRRLRLVLILIYFSALNSFLVGMTQSIFITTLIGFSLMATLILFAINIQKKITQLKSVQERILHS